MKKRLTGQHKTDCLLTKTDEEEIINETKIKLHQVKRYSWNFRHRNPMEQRAAKLEDEGDEKEV